MTVDAKLKQLFEEFEDFFLYCEDELTDERLADLKELLCKVNQKCLSTSEVFQSELDEMGEGNINTAACFGCLDRPVQ